VRSSDTHKSAAGKKNLKRHRLSRSARLESLEGRQMLAADFTLELLHVTDQEAAATSLSNISNLSAVLNTLRDEDLGSDGIADNTLTLSSGDAFIPGLFLNASEAVYGTAGIADIQIQNELGFQAIALGNHEFDLGTEFLAGLIDGSATGSILGSDFEGANFPYLSTNLDFSTDANLAGLEVAGGQAPQANSVTSSVILDVNGESIAVVGATTPTLGSISSPDGVGISPSPFGSNPSSAELDALAAEIQIEVDAILTANPSINKVVLLAHMQQINIEFELAERLSGVDIIVAGGSNTRLFDSNDVPFGDDTQQGDYPTFISDVDGNSVAVVNTDGSYKYVGRLVIGFDASGNIMPGTYEDAVSGAYATDDAGVAAIGAAGNEDPEVAQIISEIEAQIISTESNVFGTSEVFLNGNRSGDFTANNTDGVRTQETNLGNLTADANLAAAKSVEPATVLSIKNGGGIRASVGQTVVLPGTTETVRLPNEAVFDTDGNLIKPEGGISQNDIETTLAFNNSLTLLTLQKQEIVDLLEHGVSAYPGVSGAFPQISGLEFSFDPNLPEGQRVVNAAIVNDNGHVIARLVKDGEIFGYALQEFRIVTLDFLAQPRFDEFGNFIGGGDGYPFPNIDDPAIAARVNPTLITNDGPRDGEATFADNLSEQDALAEYIADNFSATPFGEADSGPVADQRIQNLDFTADTVFPVYGTVQVTNNNDFGAGSFRAAVQLANANRGVNRIVFDSGLDIVELSESVEFTGSQRLDIDGNGNTIQAADGFTGPGVFVSSGAASLDISELTVDGDFDEGETPANGIFAPIAFDANGMVSVVLDAVTLINNGLFGLHVDDQSSGSNASIKLDVYNSYVVNNGIGELDFDGIRVDEGGNGNIFATIKNTQINANGGDGLELDEAGNGSVFLTAVDSFFNENGFFNEADLDDGLDIDEAGNGSIFANLTDVVLSDNLDEGLDLDEEQSGSIHLNLRDVTANGNTDEGIKASEEDAGSIFGHFNDVQANNNGNDGFELEEADDGIVSVQFNDVEANGNDGAGIKVVEDDNGGLFAFFNDVEASDNESGLELEEEGTGILSAIVNDAEIKDNEEFGIIASQADGGAGWLILNDVDFENNDEDDLDTDGVTVLSNS